MILILYGKYELWALIITIKTNIFKFTIQPMIKALAIKFIF